MGARVTCKVWMGQALFGTRRICIEDSVTLRRITNLNIFMSLTPPCCFLHLGTSSAASIFAVAARAPSFCLAIAVWIWTSVMKEAELFLIFRSESQWNELFYRSSLSDHRIVCPFFEKRKTPFLHCEKFNPQSWLKVSKNRSKSVKSQPSDAKPQHLQFFFRLRFESSTPVGR